MILGNQRFDWSLGAPTLYYFYNTGAIVQRKINILLDNQRLDYGVGALALNYFYIDGSFFMEDNSAAWACIFFNVLGCIMSVDFR